MNFVVALAVGAIAGSGQAPTSRFGETVEVRVVNVEVVVTDADGNPVRDLQQDDFELEVDGEPVTISNFYEVKGEDLSRTAAEPDAGSFVVPPGATSRLNLAIVIDERHITPQSRAAILDQLEKDLPAVLGARDRVLVARVRDSLEILQDFTSERSPVDRALAELRRGKVPFGSTDIEHIRFLRDLANLFRFDDDQAQRNAEELAGRLQLLAEQRYRETAISVEALQNLVASLQGLPGRKAVLLLSDGIPERPAESLIEAFREATETRAQGMTGRAADDLTRLQFRLNPAESVTATATLDRLFRQAAATGTVFYPLTNQGTRSPGTRGFGAELVRQVGNFSASLEEQTLLTSLQDAAEETGGAIVTNVRGASEFLGGLRRDFSNYYSLGFTPPEGADDGYQRVRVELRDAPKGTEVRHVEGFAEIGKLERLQALAVAAATHGVAQNPLGVAIQEHERSEAKKGRVEVSVILAVPMGNLFFVESDGQHAAELDLVIVVVDEEGNASPARQDLMPVVVPSERLREALQSSAGYAIKLAMREGEQTLAVAVRDRLSGVESVATLDLDL